MLYDIGWGILKKGNGWEGYCSNREKSRGLKSGTSYGPERYYEGKICWTIWLRSHGQAGQQRGGQWQLRVSSQGDLEGSGALPQKRQAEEQCPGAVVRHQGCRRAAPKNFQNQSSRALWWWFSELSWLWYWLHKAVLVITTASSHICTPKPVPACIRRKLNKLYGL